jgi:uncharacterized protein (TIGR03083 family)
MTTEPVDQLSAALNATGQLIAAVAGEQWAHPTPCPKWNVRDLVTHVITGNYVFAGILHGALPAAAQNTFRADNALLSAYHDSAGLLLTAFGSPS